MPAMRRFAEELFAVVSIWREPNQVRVIHAFLLPS
jgi:hypothetical protein